MPDGGPRVVPNYGPAIEAFTQAFVNERRRADAVAREQDANLISAAKSNPKLWDDPRTVKAAESVYGKDAAPMVIEAMKAAIDPEHPANALLQQLGIPLPEKREIPRHAAAPAEAPRAGIFGGMLSALGIRAPEAAAPAAPTVPFTEAPTETPTQRLVREVPKRFPGARVALGAPTGPRVTIPSPTVEQRGAQLVYARIEQRRRELVEHGVTDPIALQQATREVVRQADTPEGQEAGLVVPDSARKLAEAGTTLLIEQSGHVLRREIDQATARGIEKERVAGGREARLEVPLTAEDRVAKEVAGLTLPNGDPLPAAKQTEEYLSRMADVRYRESYSAAKGTQQAAAERKAAEQAEELLTLGGNLSTFVPMASTVLTSDVFEAKGGVQAIKLYLKSGQGLPGIAALRNLQGLIPRVTKAIGGDVGNLAIQEQAAYRNIVDGTWQTGQEFVLNMLTLAVGIDRLSTLKARRAGLPAPAGVSRLFQAIQAVSADFPEIQQALADFQAAFPEQTPAPPEAPPAGAAPGAAPGQSYEDILREYGG